jgi:hypothetical protein
VGLLYFLIFTGLTFKHKDRGNRVRAALKEGWKLLAENPNVGTIGWVGRSLYPRKRRAPPSVPATTSTDDQKRVWLEDKGHSPDSRSNFWWLLLPLFLGTIVFFLACCEYAHRIPVGAWRFPWSRTYVSPLSRSSTFTVDERNVSEAKVHYDGTATQQFPTITIKEREITIQHETDGPHVIHGGTVLKLVKDGSYILLKDQGDHCVEPGVYEHRVRGSITAPPGSPGGRIVSTIWYK